MGAGVLLSAILLDLEPKLATIKHKTTKAQAAAREAASDTRGGGGGGGGEGGADTSVSKQAILERLRAGAASCIARRKART